MAGSVFSENDIKEITDHGLTVQDIEKQLEFFRRGPVHIKLNRPCTRGDGILVLSDDRRRRVEALAVEGSREGRFMKFVPSSGAATRMFKNPLGILSVPDQAGRDALSALAPSRDDAAEVLALMDSLRNCAFYPELKKVMGRAGLDLDLLLKAGDFEPVLRYMLGPDGLNYGNLPKGMLLFHRYGNESRTAFEEHLVEAVQYIADRFKRCRLHFTVSPEHMAGFRKLADAASATHGSSVGASFEIRFSTQSPSTDTIAVDLYNEPFRLPDGRLLFRPGGHGSLLENLAALDGDIVYLKNIDNVVPDHLKEETRKWKRIIGGLLLEIQSKVFHSVRKLSAGDHTGEELKAAEEVFFDDLCGCAPEGFDRWPGHRRAGFLIDSLNRPIRVCGMVRNEGEPGGGPFWVTGKDERSSLQIVESAQVDPDSAHQRRLFAEATHFNPVDLVCGLKDAHGNAFDLRKFVDPDTALISRKSRNGKDLKALEHPGLWNGAMARWLTIFVEVPVSTFNPVKTVNDLLRPSHQPR